MSHAVHWYTYSTSDQRSVYSAWREMITYSTKETLERYCVQVVSETDWTSYSPHRSIAVKYCHLYNQILLYFCYHWWSIVHVWNDHLPQKIYLYTCTFNICLIIFRFFNICLSHPAAWIQFKGCDWWRGHVLSPQPMRGQHGPIKHSSPWEPYIYIYTRLLNRLQLHLLAYRGKRWFASS